MKTILVLCIAFLMPLLPLRAQCSICSISPDFEISSAGNTKARFPHLKEYIISNLKYLMAALESGIEGRVEVAVLIGADGFVREAQIVKGLFSDCDRAVAQMLLNMPPWTPAKENGQPIAQKVNIAVDFKLKSAE